MTTKKTQLDRFSALSWADIDEWTGSKIASRGKSYQRQGLVSGLAVINDRGLIAWVEGTHEYATKVVMDEGGLPDSICTCPYELDCKHGVAVVLEYLKQLENGQRIPSAKSDDERLEMFDDEAWDDDDAYDEDENALSEDMQQGVDNFLKSKTKAQLIALIHELAGQYPGVSQALTDTIQLTSGNPKTLLTRLRREIKNIGSESGWQNYWNDEGHTPDYSGIRSQLATLLKAGHADEVLTVGQELISTGTAQVEESDDDGETAMEVADCMPIIVKALAMSSLGSEGKLNWALDTVLEDQYDLCEVFVAYLHQPHPESAWNSFADRVLLRLSNLKSTKWRDDFHRDYDRDQLSNWAIHALERSGREDEIIPLCIAEAEQTNNYGRLVKQLIAVRRYQEAEPWIQQGVQATKDRWPGIAADLRGKLRQIRTLEKNWPAVAAILCEEFVRRPSQHAFTEGKKVCSKARVWSRVRGHLLFFLEKGVLPWKQKDWPLPESGLDAPVAGEKDRFPLVSVLIEIAIFEKKPDQVLRWYDQRPKDRFGWYGVDEDVIATAVQAHAPDRSVTLWKKKAERLIAQVKPSAYQEAAPYLRKAGRVMAQVEKTAEWEQYLKGLRSTHARKRRLIEVLDGLEDEPIVRKRR